MYIRMASVDDARAILAVYAPYCATPITFELQPPLIKEMERRILEVLKKYPWLVMVDGDEVVGYAYGHEFRDRPAYRRSVETSVYVSQNVRAKGIGSALYQQLLAMLKSQRFVTAIGGVTLPNEASVKLHERFGFKFIGEYKNIGYKCDEWHGVGFFELELNPPEKYPEEPLGLDAVTGMLDHGSHDRA